MHYFLLCVFLIVISQYEFCCILSQDLKKRKLGSLSIIFTEVQLLVVLGASNLVQPESDHLSLQLAARGAAFQHFKGLKILFLTDSFLYEH